MAEMPKLPLHGFTKRGHAVHGKVSDHLPEQTRYQRLNKRAAIAITDHVGTMTCAYLFALLALISLPAAIASGALIVIVAWIAQTFLQLVLLSVILVGQKIQSIASDARTEKTFEDTEAVRADMTAALDALNTKTEGGLKEILDAVLGQTGRINAEKDS
jgi:hypothetical protein